MTSEGGGGEREIDSGDILNEWNNTRIWNRMKLCRLCRRYNPALLTLSVCLDSQVSKSKETNNIFFFKERFSLWGIAHL